MKNAPETRLGPYVLVSLIGAGGMGEVWKARDTRLDRIVAVKVSQKRFSERFEREARAVAALNHPNICQLYDVGPDYLVLEYVEGLPVGIAASQRKLIDAAVQIADGLAAAHTAGVIHRDLKPDNILITRDGRVKILDFGLAKQATPVDGDRTRSHEITDPGTVLGTASYMSPEQARGQALDARSDQFSFGLILYEMAAGERAFHRASATETMTAIIRDEVRPLPAGVPLPLRWVIERCLSKDPAERYDSTRDLYRELRQAQEHLSDALTAAPAENPAKRRRPSIAWAIAAIFGAATVAVSFWPLPPPASRPFVPFASEARIQTMPRWAPTGDRLAYVADVEGVLQVFTKSLGSSTPTPITHEPESCLGPMWSSDGSHIYYLTGSRPNVRLRSIAIAGGAATTLVENVWTADVSPDGKTLAVFVSDTPGTYRLALASPPEAAPKPYTNQPFANFRTPGVATYVLFEPDGRSLAVAANMGKGPEFWRIPMDGGAPKEETAFRGALLRSFTMPGNRNVISSPTVTQDFAVSHLLSVDLDSGASRTITTGPARELYPSVSPDGLTLAFSSGETGFDLVEFSLDGSPPREVIATAAGEVAPSWAPDGVHFVYATDRSGSAELWLRDRAYGSETRIAPAGQVTASTSFLDATIYGNRVAYRATFNGNPQIWISPLSGEAPAPLWNDPANSPQRGPTWSPNGDWIAYYGVREGKAAVMKIQVGAKDHPQVLAEMLRLGPIRWSPRNDWILYRDGDKLRAVSPDGKQNRAVSERTWETYGWSEDGARVVGIARGDHRHLWLLQIDIDSGKEALLSDLGSVPAEFDLAEQLNEFAYRGFSLRPGGKSFLTSVLRMKTQIYLMKDFDRPQRLIDRWLGQ